MPNHNNTVAVNHSKHIFMKATRTVFCNLLLQCLDKVKTVRKLVVLSVKSTAVLSIHTDAEKLHYKDPLHLPSPCCPSSITFLLCTTSLPCLFVTPQFSFSIHWPGTGPLQPLCTLSVTLSSPCLTFSSREAGLFS